MNTHNKTLAIGIVALAVLVTLALFTQLTLAQGPGPAENARPSSPAGVAADLNDIIPVQGRLTDASGNPLSGTYTINLYVYEVITGGTVLCGNWFPSTQVVNGLFNAAVHLCSAANAVEGDQLYLGVQVGSDPEMTPRQPIYAVPYAYTVKPGAVIKGDNSYVFVPGTAFIKETDTDTTRWDLSGGSALIRRGGVAIGTKHIRIPITLPSVLYGQPARVTGITVYYKCQDGAVNYVSETELYKQTSADAFVSLVNDTTNRTSNTATSYSLTTDSANNTLSASQGILTLRLGLFFNDDNNYVQIGGVRVTLDHTY
jgi:hypothetical protein